jgi:acyl-CoA reductase-like NAD-dependent aldehyde dehydrogenase
VLVIESVADILVEKVVAKMSKLTVGAPEDDKDITAVVSESSAKFIEGLVLDAKEKGATFCQVKKKKGFLFHPLYVEILCSEQARNEALQLLLFSLILIEKWIFLVLGRKKERICVLFFRC